MWNNLLLILFGLSFGALSSAGVFTVLITIGLIPRFAVRTRTSRHILVYEEFSSLGAIGGCIYSLFPSDRHPPPPCSLLMLLIYGFFTGIFVGCLALAIAEMLNAIPVFARRLRFHKGLRYAVYAMALGKLIGSLVYFYCMLGILTA